MGLKRRLIKLLAVAWQQHHLDGSPLPQLKQPRRTPGLMPAPPRIALSHLCRAPLDRGLLGEPDVDRVEEEARAMRSELQVEEVDGVSDVLAVFTGQVVRVPYPKVRRSGCSSPSYI